MYLGALTTVLDIALIGLVGFSIWGIVEIVRTARAVRGLSEELSGTVPGLLDRASVTLEAFNAELERMGSVVTQLEEVSDRVNSTTRAAQEIVEAPAAAVSGLAAGIRTFFSVLAGRRA